MFTKTTSLLTRGILGTLLLAGLLQPDAEAQPDVLAWSISGYSGALQPGDTTAVGGQLKSLGDQLTIEYPFKIMLSRDDSITQWDYEVAEKMGWLAIGTFPYFYTVTIPQGIPDGTYHWGLLVPRLQGETNTGNNWVAGNTVVIRRQGDSAPDLSIVSVSGPKKVKRRRWVDVQINTATGTYNGPFVVEIRLSKDKQIDANDLLVGSYSVSAPGLRSFRVRVPRMKVGKYRWGAIVRPVPGETRTGNNARFGNKVKVKK